MYDWNNVCIISHYMWGSRGAIVSRHPPTPTPSKIQTYYLYAVNLSKLGIGLPLPPHALEKLNNASDPMPGMKKFNDEFHYILDNILLITKCTTKCTWSIAKEEHFMLSSESTSLYWSTMICFMKLYEYFFFRRYLGS